MNFLAGLAQAFADLIAPLESSLKDAASLESLLRRLGWSATVEPSELAAIQAAMGLEPLFTAVENAVQALSSGSGDVVSDAEALSSAAAAVIAQLTQLNAVNPSGLAAPFDEPEFWAQLPTDLVGYLVVTYLKTRHPYAFGVLSLLGVATAEAVTPPGTGRVPYVQYAIDFDQATQFVNAPGSVPGQLYGWNSPPKPFNFDLLLGTGRDFAVALGLPVRYRSPDQGLVTQYYSASNPALPTLTQLSVPFLSAAAPDGSGFVELGVLLLPIPSAGPSGSPTGLFLTPIVEGSGGVTVQLTPIFSLQTSGGFDATGAVGIEILPGSVALSAAPGASTIDAQVTIVGAPPQPWCIIGDPSSSNLSLGGASVSLGVRGAVATPELVLQLATGTGPAVGQGGGNLAVDLSDADGFLQSIIGDQVINVGFAGGIEWSSVSGFHVTGQASLAATIPVHVTIGNVLSVDTVYLAVTAGGTSQSISVAVALSGSLTLGPVTATADKVGVQLDVSPEPSGSGSLGNWDLQFGFKPPDGLGISVSASSIVEGGGYLSFGQNQYAGWADLSIDILDLKVYGLLETDPVSFLLIVQAGFPPIQLGLGFTLNDVGGLVGIDRSMSLDALQRRRPPGDADRHPLPRPAGEPSAPAC